MTRIQPPTGEPIPPTHPTTVLVCTSCRREGDAEEAPRAGARLHDALAAAAGTRDDIRVVGVECLSVCKRPVTIGFAAADKWTYVYGDFAPETAEEILATAALYGAASDGLIPWKSRPAAFKKGVVARIPPFTPAPSEAE
jgi:predicted metal-binding protein